MNYIPKYSKERQKKRQSQKYVTVINIDSAKELATPHCLRNLREIQLKLQGFDQ